MKQLTISFSLSDKRISLHAQAKAGLSGGTGFYLVGNKRSSFESFLTTFRTFYYPISYNVWEVVEYYVFLQSLKKSMANKSYNLEKLNEIAQGDDGFIREMVATFVENVTVEIESIQKLKSEESWTAIAEIAHKLASNFAYLGADDLHALACNIEKSVIGDRNLSGIPEKTAELCSSGELLISELKIDFNIPDLG